MLPPQTDTSVTIGQSPNLYHTETLANGLTIVVQENRDSRVIGINLLAKETRPERRKRPMGNDRDSTNGCSSWVGRKGIPTNHSIKRLSQLVQS